MKRGLSLIIVLAFCLYLIPFAYCQTKTSFDTSIELNVLNEENFQVGITTLMDTSFWSPEDWTIILGNNLKNVKVSNEKGNINIKETKEEGDWISYIFNAGFTSSSGFKPIYINSTGTLKKINDNLYLLYLPVGTYWSESADENIKINIKVPSSLEFLTAEGYNKKDFVSNGASITLNYKNKDSYNILFMKKEASNQFTSIQDDNKEYFVENNEKLIKGVNELIINKDLVTDYPYGKKDFIVISISNTSSLDKNNIDVWGLCYQNNLILADNSLIRDGSKEELTSVLIHEFTHYSKNSYFSKFIYPNWLTEGLAVYSEIKYIAKTFPDFGGNIPSNLNLYSRQPDLQTLNLWYEKDKDFFTEDYLETFTNQELYPLYGFPINYYAKTYGENNLKSVLASIKQKKQNEENKFGYLKDSQLRDIVLNAFSTFSNNLSRTGLFFPSKNVWNSDKNQFEKEMNSFIVQSISAEDMVKVNKYQTNQKSSFPRIYWILGLILLLIIIFFIYKRFKKNKKLIKK